MNKKVLFTMIAGILIISLLCAGSVQALSKYGSYSDEVRQIQTKLTRLNLYAGGVDGIYGSKTMKAVKQFQSQNGLTADGVAGPQTLKALGITSDGYGQYTQNDINVLARLVSAEARGESYTGQVAVAAVVLNRVQHPSFPDTVAGVIYQNGAFTCITDGQFDQPVADSAYKAAQDAIGGWDPSGGAIYYYNPRTATNQWIRSRPVLKTIGKHIFCS